MMGDRRFLSRTQRRRRNWSVDGAQRSGRRARTAVIAAMFAGGLLGPLCSDAWAAVDISAPPSSVYCQQPVQLGIARDYRPKPAGYHATVSVRTRSGRLLKSWHRIAPARGWLYWSYVPHVCGRVYRVVYLYNGGSDSFNIRVLRTPVGFGAP